MRGNSFLLDTNIILYLLDGKSELAEILDGTIVYISFVSELELLTYKGLTGSERKKISLLLNEFVIVDINSEIKLKTIDIRSESNLKLPDCIIAATAAYLNITLFTADKDFSKVKNLDLILYESN
jgi:predicted nucleic acid-binding protein